MARGAAISGVADQSTDMSKPLLPRPTTFYLGWDPEHLYFAARTYIKARAQAGRHGRPIAGTGLRLGRRP